MCLSLYPTLVNTRTAFHDPRVRIDVFHWPTTMFLSIAPKRPGAAYDKVNNPDRFRSVADMDMICADDAATLFP
eukprot:gene6590-6330_t